MAVRRANLLIIVGPLEVRDFPISPARYVLRISSADLRANLDPEGARPAWEHRQSVIERLLVYMTNGDKVDAVTIAGKPITKIDLWAILDAIESYLTDDPALELIGLKMGEAIWERITTRFETVELTRNLIRTIVFAKLNLRLWNPELC